jgi:SAM-dependent methyltransferase
MHLSAWLTARVFFDLVSTHLDSNPSSNRSIEILDIGSYNRNGCLRSPLSGSAIDDKFNINYIGVDLEHGPNVDVVTNSFENLPFAPNFFDMVISSSTFEHDPMFWVTFLHLSTVLKPGGFLYISAPNSMEYHAFPIDAWRFNEDSGASLAKWARYSGFEIELIYTNIFSGIFGETVKDNVMVFYKQKSAHISDYLKLFFTNNFTQMFNQYCSDPNIVIRMVKDFKLFQFISSTIKISNGSSWIITNDFSLTPVLPEV